MPPKKPAPARKAVSPSPDPLASSDHDSDVQHIPTPSKSKATPKSRAGQSAKSTPKSGKARKERDDDDEEGTGGRKRRKVDGSPTPSRSKATEKVTPGKKARTSLSKASPASNVVRGGNATPAPSSNKKPRPASAMSAKKSTPTLGASTTKPLPTPGRPRASASTKPLASSSGTPGQQRKKDDPIAMPNFDEAFDPSPSSSSRAGAAAILGSRETFLTNESMKRAREARNFLYEGEADAPTLTRSGRVIGAGGKTKGRGREREVDEYGEVIDADADTEDEAEATDGEEADGRDGDEMEVDEEEHRGIQDRPGTLAVEDEPEMEVESDGKDHRGPLPGFMRKHFVDILHTLTGRDVSTNPPPFEEEGTNEALNQLLGVLQGTVERGEGNSALIVGPRGTGKTRLLRPPKGAAPIIVRLSGHAQINDRLAIREMGRQIAEAEGHGAPGEGDEDGEEEGDGEEYAPTTLPSHLLALLTAPSPRAIVIIMEEFDLFTEHARQALLYCLLDVVQSIKTGPVESTGRGVAVIGITTRTDTLLLLEKRVKSRFSHRIFRVLSPLAQIPTKDRDDDDDALAPWQKLLSKALIPWSPAVSEITNKPIANGHHLEDEEELWKGDWEFAIETLLKEPRVVKYMSRVAGLSTDVRNLYRPFIPIIASMLSESSDFILARNVSARVIEQIEGAGWGLQNSKIRGLPHPAMGILIISKHLHYAGREEFNFAQVEEEYLRFARTKLVGSGKTRWAVGVLRTAYDHLLRLGILTPTHTGSVRPQFQRVRCVIGPHEVVGWFKGEGANLLGPELGNWGRMMGGHA